MKWTRYAAVLLLTGTACSGAVSDPPATSSPTVAAPTPEPTPEPKPEPVAEKEGCLFKATVRATSQGQTIGSETVTFWLPDGTPQQCRDMERRSEDVVRVDQRPRGKSACDVQVKGVRVVVYGGKFAKEFYCAALEAQS